MRIDERSIAIASLLFAVAGIALLFLMSETPQKASVAQALVAQENTLLEIYGTAANVTGDKFYLCSGVCISVRKMELASASLVSEGRGVHVFGRVKEYQGNRYIEAEGIGVE